MIVVDASVWVSYVLPQDTWHHASTQFLDAATATATVMVVPALFLAEVGATVARQTTSEAGRVTREQLLEIDLFRWIPIDMELAQAAAQLAAELQLRGADSVYVAIAAQLGLPLISWDHDHRTRATARIPVYTPTDAP